MLNFLKKEKKKDLPTYIPKLKLMGRTRSTANKYIFKDGLRQCNFMLSFCLFMSICEVMIYVHVKPSTTGFE